VFESIMTVTPADLTDIVIEKKVPGASHILKAVLATPEGTGPWPAVVVVHEVFGIETEMRKQAAHLASLGYLTLMPDLFSDGGARRCLVATMRSVRSGEGRAYADIESARQWLLARPDATGAVGVIGFCMGGGFALMTAASFDVASVNYGMLPKDLEVSLEHACPIVGSYGGKDKSLKSAASKLDAVLTTHGIEHDIKEYPDAGHAFLNEKAVESAFMKPLARVLGLGPNPEASVDAWNRIDSFLKAHLSPSGSQSS
jgi:carboxymethylenebutenolidase